MVVVVEKNASEKDIENIIKKLNEFGFDVHRDNARGEVSEWDADGKARILETA